jgi:hydrogenase expression/formation protein HypC
MCIGVPMRVLEAGTVLAWCEGRGERRRLDLRLVGPQPAGTWVLAFVDAARSVLTSGEAADIDRALDGLAVALAGDVDSIDAFFPDLVGREPELPEHLRAAASASGSGAAASVSGLRAAPASRSPAAGPEARAESPAAEMKRPPTLLAPLAAPGGGDQSLGAARRD